MMMRVYFQRSSRGFTLIEILITVVVLSTGLVLVLQGLHGVLHVWDGGVQRIRSVMAAQEQFALIQHDAIRGEVPAPSKDLMIEAQVGGHRGLYRVTYRDETAYFDKASEYEMLFFIAPDEETRP